MPSTPFVQVNSSLVGHDTTLKVLLMFGRANLLNTIRRIKDPFFFFWFCSYTWYQMMDVLKQFFSPEKTLLNIELTNVMFLGLHSLFMCVLLSDSLVD